MDAIFGMEFPLLIKFVVSFAIVLALIGIAALLFKRFGAKGLTNATPRRGRQPRLAVVDTAPVDNRRSLVIVRRDNVEHLLLIGGPTDLLVEPNISQIATHVVPEPVAAAAVRSVASDLPSPNWTAGNTSWPVAAQTDTSPRVEPARKPEPRPEPVVRSEPVFLPEPAQRPDPDVRIQQVPSFEPAPASAAVRSVPAQADFSLSPQDHPVPAYIPPAPVRVAPRSVEEVPPAPVAQDLDAAREVVNGAAALHHAPTENPPARQATVAPASPVRRVEAAFNEDQNLADMAQRLEAALRRPLGANGAAAPPQAALRPVQQVRPSPSVHVQRQAPAVAAVAAPAVSAVVAAAPAVRSEAQTYENLQREMASLLGRKPGSS